MRKHIEAVVKPGWVLSCLAATAVILTVSTALTGVASTATQPAPVHVYGRIQTSRSGVTRSNLGRTAMRPHPRIFLDPVTLGTLRSRARANTPEWQALKARCDAFLTGTVEWPDGNNYPDSNSVGAGYQGDGYMPALFDIGLCYQTEIAIDSSTAQAYAAKGADVLEKMTAPSGPHAPNPLRDSGYGIRFYVVGLALGYDWLHPALSDGLRQRVIAAMHRWIAAFEKSGFENAFPQGNYFAGYYDAKALAAIATQGDDPNSGWNDFLSRVQDSMVQPYYSANLSGGGWPEGWNYGPFGTLNMSWPAIAASTGLGIDMIHSGSRPFSFPLNAARFLLYFTWPDLKTEEDSDFLYDSDNPSLTHHWLVTFESALLSRFHDPFAAYFHSYARAVRAVQPEGEFGNNWDQGIDFLFWNDAAPEISYHRLPLSYRARGIEMAATRSSWSSNGVWAELKAGPYTNYPENGEELFDQGSLAIVNGRHPFLVNAWGALVRNTPGTGDGSPLWQKAYDDVLGDGGQRDLFNVFYINGPAPGQGQHLRSDGARTSIDRFDDAGNYVVMRGSHLEDNYPRDSGAPRTVEAWTREVVYLRPDLFVVFDRTQVSSPSLDQRMDFHFEGPLVNRGAGRFDAGSGSTYAGTFQSVLPLRSRDSIVDVFDAHKVYRLEVRPPGPATSVRWLTVLDAASSSRRAVLAHAISASGGVGALLTGPGRSYAVVQSSGSLRYTLPATSVTRNLVTGLNPGAGYSVRKSRAGNETVSVRPGGATKASSAGVLSFTTP